MLNRPTHRYTTARLRLAAALLGLLFLLGCSAIRPLPPEVNLVNLQLTDLTLTHANLLAQLKVFNPNSLPVNITDVDYSLFLNDIPVSHGQAVKQVRIGAEESGEVPLRLSSAYWDLLRILNQAQSGREVKFNLKGSVRVSGAGIFSKTFDFAREGVVPLQQLQP